MSALVCPKCGSADVWGHDGMYHGIYDGVIYWSCAACRHRWHRFAPPDRRYDAVERLWAKGGAEDV